MSVASNWNTDKPVRSRAFGSSGSGRSGRSRNVHGLGVSVEIPPEEMAKIRRFERLSPQSLRRAYALAASNAKKGLFSVMRNHGSAKYSVPKLARRQPLTRRLNGGKPSEVFGKFATDSAYHVAYLRGETQVIGWPDRLHTFLSALQDGASRDWTDGEKRHIRGRLQEKGAKAPRLPASYQRPERPLIDPYAAALVRLYPEWIVKLFEKDYNRRMKAR